MLLLKHFNTYRVVLGSGFGFYTCHIILCVFKDTTDQAAFDKHTDEALDVIMDHVGSQVEGSALRNLKQVRISILVSSAHLHFTFFFSFIP